MVMPLKRSEMSFLHPLLAPISSSPRYIPFFSLFKIEMDELFAFICVTVCVFTCEIAAVHLLLSCAARGTMDGLILCLQGGLVTS
jgi:hypothetical protein